MQSRKRTGSCTHTCPVWAGYLLLCPIRKLFHPPEKILNPFIKKGMRVLEIGPAMGFFTLTMAEMVGDTGKVYAVDIQQRMLNVLQKRAEKKGLSHTIECILASADNFNIHHLKDIDFCLLFAVVHEVADPEKLFKELFKILKPRAQVLMVEPKGHVARKEFERFLKIASNDGFIIVGSKKIFRSHSSILQKPA